jgi:hypothetical protein
MNFEPELFSDDAGLNQKVGPTFKTFKMAERKRVNGPLSNLLI